LLEQAPSSSARSNTLKVFSCVIYRAPFQKMLSVQA
jgi:hypothetical protein